MFTYILFSESARERCFTDGNGPDVFTKCAKKWVAPNHMTVDEYRYYDDVDGNGECSKRKLPSALNEVCLTFHDKIEELR